MSLDYDSGISNEYFSILNFTRLIIVGANGGDCIVLHYDLFILLEAGCDVVIFHVMNATLINSFDALVLCSISGMRQGITHMQPMYRCFEPCQRYLGCACPFL